MQILHNVKSIAAKYVQPSINSSNHSDKNVTVNKYYNGPSAQKIQNGHRTFVLEPSCSQSLSLHGHLSFGHADLEI